MPFDSVTYLRCMDCGSFVVEGEAEAHESNCGESSLLCRVCGEPVGVSALHQHLVEHHPSAHYMSADEVRDHFTAAADYSGG